MSKLTDYSKFDQIDTESDEEEATHNSTTRLNPADARMIHDSSKTGRYFFLFQNRRVYEWEQTLSEVIVYVAAPPNRNVSKISIDCQIAPNHVKLRLLDPQREQNPYFLDEPTFGSVEVDKSFWCIEQVETTTDDDDQLKEIKMIVIYLQKANKAVVWENVFTGKFPDAKLDPMQVENAKQSLLLERYQEEHGGGFDFRDAKITGSVPDPRTFMGGVKHD